MTCQEFREMTKRSILVTTRAQRSARLSHLDGCPECRAFLKAGGKLDPDSQRAAQIYKIYDEDVTDPE